MRPRKATPALFLLLAPLSCFSNNPYRAEDATRNVYYDTFLEEPRTLDPAKAYSSDEYDFMCQIYEPIVQYHFLKRPYVLTPLTADAVPEARLVGKDGATLPPDAPPDQVARVIYEIRLQPGIRYQDHPCFAKSADGGYRWHLGPGAAFPEIDHPDELPGADARELLAEDYVYQIKRLAHPLLECPLGALFANYIEGFSEFGDTVNAEVTRIREERRAAAGVFYNQEADERANPIYLDLRQYDLPGAQVVDARTFRIVLVRPYPQFVYWLAMPFFAPVPWEADRFHTQSAAAARNITLDRFPIGTGPFTLAVNRPNFQMVLRRNRNFRGETYPSEGDPIDRDLGLLEDAGKPLPFLDEAVFVLEKESVPRWAKFLQGYYDNSAIGSDMFDQAVRMTTDGAAGLTESLEEKKIRLLTAVSPSTYYLAFNMLDDVVGGYDEKKCKLRRALSIAFNIEEYIQIFANGRGIAAQGPVPPGLFGYQEGREGVDPFTYEWDERRGAPRRKSLAYAKELLAEAGYPGGRDADGKQLVVYFDTTDSGAGSKAFLDWMRKQFTALGVEFQERSTDYNRFQEKILAGNFQLLWWGWNADYPDPENFLFLLNGPNSKVKSEGENAANYDNPHFNELFKRMETMPSGPERAEIIREMLAIARHDAPWIWGYHPIGYGLYQEWYRNTKPMAFGSNALKYKKVDPAMRALRRAEWNEPRTMPLWIAAGFFVLGSLPATLVVWRRMYGRAAA